LDVADDGEENVQETAEGASCIPTPAVTELDERTCSPRVDVAENVPAEADEVSNKHDAFSVVSRSTIAPELVRDRVRKQLAQGRHAAKPKIRGGADAVRRKRNANKDVVKEYAGWDDF